MQTDMFPDERHDAGGRVKTKLPAGLRGDAVFSGNNSEYRPILRRWIGEAFPDRYVLWVGMNPSTATAELNDSTITREWGFTAREGFAGYIKCNVSDYRATDPKKLLQPGLSLQSAINRAAILEMAADAEYVICCWGSVNRALAPLAASLLADLRVCGAELWCLGMNANGSPKHPLYLASNTLLVRF